MCGRNMLQKIKKNVFISCVVFVWTVYYASVFDIFCLLVYLMYTVTAVIEFDVQVTVHRDKLL